MEAASLPASLERLQRVLTIKDPGHEPRPGDGRYHFLHYFYAPKILLLCFVMVVTLNAVDVVKFDADETARRLPLRNALACYSATFAHIILAHRKKTLLRAVAYAKQAATVLTEDAPPEAQLAFQEATRRKTLYIWKFFSVYSTLMGVTASLATITAPSVVNQMLREYSVVLVWLKCAAESFTIMACCWNVSSLLIFVVDVNYSCAVLFREIGRRLASGKGVAHTGPAASAYALVEGAARSVNSATGYLLPHYVMATFVVPLLSTASLVQKPEKSDIFDVLSFPLMFLFFGPICEASQYLQNASGAVATQAYRGPWLDEGPPCRRVRLQIMLHSSARPLCFRVEGLGSLNRPLSRKLATSWFQYLQVLQNVRPTP